MDEDDLIPEVSLLGDVEEDIPEITLSVVAPVSTYSPQALEKPKSETLTIMSPETDYPYSPYYNDGVAPQPGEQPPVKQENPYGLTKEQILEDPAKLDAIRTYMSKRMSTIYSKDYKPPPIASVRPGTSIPAGKTDSETLEDFITHMRWMNTNEVNTLGEVANVIQADEATRAEYGEAYKVYDELGSMFYNDGITGTLDAVSDYGTALITSPSTWMGGIIGRSVARVGTKIAQKKLIEMTASKVATSVAKVSGETAALVARKQVIDAGKRYSALKAATIASGVDGFTSMAVQDRAYQEIMLRTGVQDKWNYAQSALAALSGVVGGAVTYIPEMSRVVKLTGLEETASKIVTSQMNKEATSLGKFRPRMKKAIDQLTTDWEKMAKSGQALDADGFLRRSSVDWFFSLDNENSFVRILQESGAKLDFTSDKTLSHQLTEFATNLPQEFKEGYTEALKPLGVSFGEMLDIFSSVMKGAGTDQSKASLAKKFLQEYQNVTVAKRNAAGDVISGELEDKVEEKINPKVIEYVTSVWKRALVSHPATTMANIKGWGFAGGARALSEIVHGGILGSVGLAQKLMRAKIADTTLAQSSALFKSQIFMAKTLLDPYSSLKGFTELLNAAPKKYSKEVLQSFYGGVKKEGPKMFGITDSRVTRGTEKALDIASELSFVRTQDLYTKTFSGLKELDKQIRLKYKVGLSELLDTGRATEITDEMWDKTVKTLMSDTFSADFTRGKDIFSRLAKGFEEVANLPGIGFIIPFPRFLNNTVAFTTTYSPVGMIKPIFNVFKGDVGMDTQDRLIKGLVGTSIIAHLTLNEGEKEKEGLQWYEERIASGEIKNVANVFPQSVYNLAGRALHMIGSGQGLTKDLQNDIAKQLPLYALNDLISNKFVEQFLKIVSDPSATGTEEFAEYVGLVGTFAASIAGTALSGFTRPLDSFNDAFGVYGQAKGWIDNAAIDKKQAEGIDSSLQEFSRYTNNFFNLLLGTEQEDGRRFYGKPLDSATEKDPVRQANPMSDLFGTTIQPPQTNIDRLLGMTNLPPWRQDSYSGDPLYDAFIDDNIFPLIEGMATSALKNPYFNKMAPAMKQDFVVKLLSDARDTLLDRLDQGYVGSPDEILLNERRKLLLKPKAMVAEAKKALGFETEDRKLTMFQIEAIRYWIEMEEEFQKSLREKM